MLKVALPSHIANTGIGYASAEKLAAMNATVVLACRDEAKAKIARDQINARTGKQNVEVALLDCANLDSVRKFAQAWGTRKIDVLIKCVRI